MIAPVCGHKASQVVRGVCRPCYDRARAALRRTGEWPEGLTDGRRAADSPNPWANRIACPSCGSAEWTMPWAPGEPRWRAVCCHLDFVPELA